MSDSNRIATNLRTLRILEILGKSDTPMTPTQINAELGLPKQTIHRLCKTLVEEGYLVPDKTKGVRPARRLRNLASGVLFASRFHIARHQILQSVAAKVSETVNFVVPEENGMKYLDRVETDWPFRIQLPVGTHVPFHCTASGKTFLASLPPKARKSMIAGLKLDQLTPNTRTDPESLLEELSKVRKNGYSVDNEEFIEGMIAVAVPITDETGRFIASIAFHAPTQRVSLQEAISKQGIMKSGAEQLGQVLLS